MKYFIALLIGIKLMAQEITPYPFPNYDSDLIAKEIVNGTYMASIKMMIKNSQTGDERYVFVPDSVPLVEDSKKGARETNNSVEYISDTPIYNRDKILEDAVLPKYTDIDDDLAIIVSYAQCPQKLEYLGEQAGVLNQVARFHSGNEKFFVGIETTDDKETINQGDDIVTFYRFKGMEKTAMFTVDLNEIYVSWLYSVGDRNFFSSGASIYEYSSTGYTKLIDLGDAIVNLPFILMDGDSFYAVTFFDGNLIATDIDTGYKIQVDTDFSISSKYQVSAYGKNIFYTDNFLAKVEDGSIVIKDNYKKWEHSNVKVRFEYLDDNLATKFNIGHGHPIFTKSKRPSSREETLLGLKEGYISIENNVLFYTKDYKNYLTTDISIKNNAKIAIFDDYIYLYETNKLVIVKVDGWSTKIPSDKYAELFAKNKMLNSQISIPRIGD